MVLLSVRKEDGWILSTFNLTYKVGWDNICKAIYATYDCYENVEVLIDDKTIEINSKEEILKLEEAGNMTIRGMCKIINAWIMIKFYNQLNVVNVTMPCVTKDFDEVSYEKFNLAIGQYMDSLELAMYR